MSIVLMFLYVGFVAWLTLATFINYVLKPVNALVFNTGFALSGGASLIYAALWALAFTLPAIKVALIG